MIESTGNVAGHSQKSIHECCEYHESYIHLEIAVKSKLFDMKLYFCCLDTYLKKLAKSPVKQPSRIITLLLT